MTFEFGEILFLIESIVRWAVDLYITKYISFSFLWNLTRRRKSLDLVVKVGFVYLIVMGLL